MKYIDKITISKKDGKKILSFISNTDREAEDIHATYRKCLPGFFEFLNNVYDNGKDISKTTIIETGVNLFSGILNNKFLMNSGRCKYTVDIVRISKEEDEDLKKKKEIVSNIKELGLDLNINPEDIESLLKIFSNNK